MKTISAVAALAIVGLVACDPVVGPEVSPNFSAHGGNGVVQSATGSGHFRQGDGNLRTFTASAVKHADGSVSGQAQINNRTLGVKAHISIDCLLIVGNVAVLSGVVTTSSDARRVGSGVFFAMEDNGEGNNAPADRITQAFPAPPTIPDLCIVVGLPHDGFFGPIEKGNIQVRG